MPWPPATHDDVVDEVDNLRASVVTGGPVRVAGGALHLFNDPAIVPASPQEGDLWVGDTA